MRLGKTGKRPPLPKLQAIAVPLAGFILILVCLNVYQYLRVRSNLADTIINQITDTEITDLQNMVNTVADKLRIVRDWAKNGVLEEDNIQGLNKKFIPLIEHQSPLSGILLADSEGWEYYLRPEGATWITRSIDPRKKGILFYQQWETPDKAIKQWQKKSDYSPRTRPWFHRPGNSDEIYWTPVYQFFDKQIKGVSASISWNIDDRKDHFAVFAQDIPLKELRRLLAARDGERPGILFFVNPYSDYYILEETPSVEHQSRYNDLIPKLIKIWKEAGQPVQEIIRTEGNKQRWLATFRPILQGSSTVWIGIAASEKELAAGLRKTLFDIDLVDLLAGLGGGGLLLLIIWWNGGLTPGRVEPEDPVLKVHRLINQGEGNTLEFKSTVRMNLKNGKPGKEIEFAWLKAVIAFLNSDGGTLLIGVADNGKVVGIEADNFENDDRCLLHIKNLFNQHVGAEFSDFVDFRIIELDDKKVILAECHSTGKPVFLKVGKNEEFFIRSGPSNAKLSPSQMLRYIQQKK
jgi:hypothetical protein